MYVTSQWFHVTPLLLIPGAVITQSSWKFLAILFQETPMVRFTEMGNNPKTAPNFAELEDFHKEIALYKGKQEAFRWVFGEESRMKINWLLGHLKYRARFSFYIWNMRGLRISWSVQKIPDLGHFSFPIATEVISPLRLCICVLPTRAAPRSAPQHRLTVGRASASSPPRQLKNTKVFINSQTFK